MPLLGKLSLILVIYDTTSDEACSKEDKSEDSCILTADLPISLESILAFTFIWPFCVDTRCIRVTVIGLGLATFINVYQKKERSKVCVFY